MLEKQRAGWMLLALSSWSMVSCADEDGGGFAAAVLLLLGVSILLFVVALVGGLTGYAAAVLQWNTTPVPGDPRAFRVSESYNLMAEYAGEGACLEHLSATYVKSDGSMDLLASYQPEAIFVFSAGPVGAVAPVGAPRDLSALRRVQVTVARPWSSKWIRTTHGRYGIVNRGIRRELLLPIEPTPAPPPKCSLRQIWQAAMALGAPADAVATVRYDRTGYRFAIGREISIAFDTNGTVLNASGLERRETT